MRFYFDFSPHVFLLWSFPQPPSHYFFPTRVEQTIFKPLKTSSSEPRFHWTPRCPEPQHPPTLPQCAALLFPLSSGIRLFLPMKQGGGKSQPLQESKYLGRNFKNGSGHLFQESVALGPSHERTGSYEWRDSTSTSALAVEKFLAESFFLVVFLFGFYFSLSIPSLSK